jgi:hypothetical protein
VKVRADIAELLRERLPESHIASQLGIDRGTVRRARQALGLPAPPRGKRSKYASLSDAFRNHTEPVDGGHLHWTGPTDGTFPYLTYGGKRYAAPRLAFQLHHGREPVGRISRISTCDFPSCVEGGHLLDRAIREAHLRADAAYEAIFGAPP